MISVIIPLYNKEKQIEYQEILGKIIQKLCFFMICSTKKSRM